MTVDVRRDKAGDSHRLQELKQMQRLNAVGILDGTPEQKEKQ